jgi:hypothetical protein
MNNNPNSPGQTQGVQPGLAPAGLLGWRDSMYAKKEINRMAMDLVGELQMVPAEDAYEKVKQYLNDAWKRGEAEEAKRIAARPNAIADSHRAVPGVISGNKTP